MNLQPHEQRVVAELKELRQRLQKLDTFVSSRTFVNLPPEDRELLVIQQHLMSALSFVLARRIARFPPPVQPLESIVSSRDEVLAAMRESPTTRELYMGAGGPWCFVTSTPNLLRISLDEAKAMEREGLIARKWPDYAEWWLLATDGVGVPATNQPKEQQ